MFAGVVLALVVVLVCVRGFERRGNAGGCRLQLGVCRPTNKSLRAPRQRAEEMCGGAATEGRKREIRACLLHIGCGVVQMLECARRIQSRGS